MSKPLQPKVQETTQMIRDGSPDSKLSHRCWNITRAYGEHVITLKDLTYALIQAQVAQITSGEVRANHYVPDRPHRPTKKASTEAWRKYYKEMRSHETALNLNHEAERQVKVIRYFDLELRAAADRIKKGKAQEGDDYDYTIAKEWGVYIATGERVDVVLKYLGPVLAKPRDKALVY